MKRSAPILLPPLLILLSWPVIRGMLIDKIAPPIIPVPFISEFTRPIAHIKKSPENHIATTRIPNPQPAYGYTYQLAKKLYLPASDDNALSPKSRGHRHAHVKYSMTQPSIALPEQGHVAMSSPSIDTIPEAIAYVPTAQTFRAAASMAPIPQDIEGPNPPARLSLYSYIFLRSDATRALVSEGQYGGSQGGVQISYALSRHPTAPKLTLAVASNLQDSTDREVTPGLTWQPAQSVPLRLHAQRRFKQRSNDSISLFLSGGFDISRLPADLYLSGYGQAGVDIAKRTGRDHVAFHDAALRLDRKLIQSTSGHINAGLILRSGGQSGLYRLDIGPSLGFNAHIGPVQLDLKADYRIKIAGQAAPGNGPALTVSASY